MKDYPGETPALITGWGRVVYQSSFHPKTLQMATTNLVSEAKCKQVWGAARITPRMQCVGGNGLNSACKVSVSGVNLCKTRRTSSFPKLEKMATWAIF